MEVVWLDVEVLTFALVFVVLIVLRVEERFLLLYDGDRWILLGLFWLLFPLFLQLQPSLVLPLLPGYHNLLVAQLSGVAVATNTAIGISFL